MENQLTTKKCPSCQKEVSFDITKCPYCGKGFRSWFRRHPILTILIALFVFPPFLIGIFSSPKKPSSSPEKPEQVNETKQQENTEAEKRQSEEERQRKINSLANKFCENRQGEYSYGYWICGGCVDLDSIINLFASSGEVKITNAKKPPTEQSCEEVSELCLRVWTEEKCSGVAEQKLWIGMTDSQLYISLGVPKDKNNTMGSWGIHSQWVYGDFGPYVYLEGKSKNDLLVTSWQD